MGHTGTNRSEDRSFRPTTWMAALLAGTVLVSGCAEDQVILPGERQGLREVLSEPEFDTVAQETSRPIRLASTTANSEWIPAQENDLQ